MKFKLDREFEKLCSLMNADVVKTRSELAEMFETDNIDYPIDVAEAIMSFDTHEVLEKLRTYFKVEEISDDAYDAFLSSTFIGDGDCPECGGYMEWDRNDYDEVFLGKDVYGEERWGRETYSVNKCPDCGYEEKFYD